MKKFISLTALTTCVICTPAYADDNRAAGAAVGALTLPSESIITKDYEAIRDHMSKAQDGVDAWDSATEAAADYLADRKIEKDLQEGANNLGSPVYDEHGRTYYPE